MGEWIYLYDWTTRNPHAPDRYTGGSSSGSAAIVASGLCSVALGTDGGGSIRIPSSLCGVVGLKTTHGRTDMKGHAAILGSSPAERVSLNPVGDLLRQDDKRKLNKLKNRKHKKFSKERRKKRRRHYTSESESSTDSDTESSESDSDSDSDISSDSEISSSSDDRRRKRKRSKRGRHRRAKRKEKRGEKTHKRRDKKSKRKTKRASDSLSESESGHGSSSSSEDDDVRRASDGKHKSMEKKTG